MRQDDDEHGLALGSKCAALGDKRRSDNALRSGIAGYPL
jgi:hypothetical protein